MTAQVPAYLQRYQPRNIGEKLSQNLGTSAPPYVSIQGNRFTLIDAAGNEMPVPTFDPQIGVYLDACIIDVGDHISRVFYINKFDPSAQSYTPPDCWSDNGLAPSISCNSPQSPTCASCPNAVWGSAISAQGKQIPACQLTQKTALLIPGIPQTVFLLRVPPNSHKHLRAYVELSRGSGVNISDVLTRIHFDLTTQGTLLFKGVQYIDEQLAALRENAYAEKKTDNLVGRNDVPRQVVAMQQIAAPAQVALGAIPVQMASSPPAKRPTLANTPYVPPAVYEAPTASPQAPSQSPPVGATTASPSEAPATPRRRRRTAAEMQAANRPVPGQAPTPAPAAPFQRLLRLIRRCFRRPSPAYLRKDRELPLRPLVSSAWHLANQLRPTPSSAICSTIFSNRGKS